MCLSFSNLQKRLKHGLWPTEREGYELSTCRVLTSVWAKSCESFTPRFTLKKKDHPLRLLWCRSPSEDVAVSSHSARLARAQTQLSGLNAKKINIQSLRTTKQSPRCCLWCAGVAHLDRRHKDIMKSTKNELHCDVASSPQLSTNEDEG